MGKRTEQIFDIIRQRIDDDENLETGTIAMDGLDTIIVGVEVSLSSDRIDSYLEEKRDELLELLPDGVDLTLMAEC